MKTKNKWIACPECGDVISPYNENVEKSRKEQQFKSYCGTCKTAVNPIYL